MNTLISAPSNKGPPTIALNFVQKYGQKQFLEVLKQGELENLTYTGGLEVSF